MLANFKKNRNKKIDSFKNKFFKVLIGAFFLGLAVVLIIANLKIKEKRRRFASRIEEFKKEIQILEEKNKKLKEEIAQVGSGEYLEKIAREQFALKSPGEKVVVVKKEKNSLPENVRKKPKKSFWNPKTWWEWIIK